MKKLLLTILSIFMIMGLCGCGSKKEEKVEEKEEAIPVIEMYENNSFVVAVNYEGLNLDGLERQNKLYGSENYGTADVTGGCSITFAQYFEGTIGAVRNMDLQQSDYTAYEMMVLPGENVKYPFWGLAYTGMDEKSYYEVLETGLSKNRYEELPFTTTDTMSFGYTKNGDRSALYCAILMRSSEQDENGNYIYACKGTNPGAPIRCAVQSVPTLISAQCVTIDEAIAYLGACDEDYNRIYPYIEPTLDVYTFNIETETKSNHWFEVVAMEDSTGRHGVMEFMDDKAIWHEGIDYSFNFFLQEDYLYNEDGTYKQQHGAGIGRYEATVPYLDKVITMQDHIDLMDAVSYSHMTYYNEEADYVGYDWANNPVDWRSEYTGANPWAAYAKFQSLGLDTSVADKKYPLYASYLNTNTNKIEVIRSFAEYNSKKDYLKPVYDMNFVLADENYDEMMNYIRWNGAFYGSLTMDEVRATGSGWETYFRVVADPMNFRVTRWFNENITTADTYLWNDFANLIEIANYVEGAK